MTTERLTPLTDLESDALAELANVAIRRHCVAWTLEVRASSLNMPAVLSTGVAHAIASRIGRPKPSPKDG